MEILFWLFVFLVDGIICGIVTNKILDNRGIYKNWVTVQNPSGFM